MQPIEQRAADRSLAGRAHVLGIGSEDRLGALAHRRGRGAQRLILGRGRSERELRGSLDRCATQALHQ